MPDDYSDCFIAPERPENPDSEPVTIPAEFLTYSDVHSFFIQHRAALTWDQVDRLVQIYDDIKRRIPTKTDSRIGYAEQVLIDAWKNLAGCPDYDEKLYKMAEVAARLLGKPGTSGAARVKSVYDMHGVRAANRAIIDLYSEKLDPDKKMAFLDFRASVQKKGQHYHGTNTQ